LCGITVDAGIVVVLQMAEPPARGAGKAATQETLETELESSIECLRQVKAGQYGADPMRQASFVDEMVSERVWRRPWPHLCVPVLYPFYSRLHMDASMFHLLPVFLTLTRHTLLAAWHHPRLLQTRK
jgi:hypothetical protein